MILACVQEKQHYLYLLLGNTSTIKQLTTYKVFLVTVFLTDDDAGKATLYTLILIFPIFFTMSFNWVKQGRYISKLAWSF